MKAGIYFLILTVLATQILVNAEDHESTQVENETTQEDPNDTSVAVSDDEKNCTKIEIYGNAIPETNSFFNIPEVACVMNLLQVILALPLKFLDLAFVGVLILRVGQPALMKLANKHLQTKTLLETLGLGVNNILSSAVGGVFNIIGMGEVAKVPLKLISQVTSVGLGIVDKTIGKIPIVGGLLTDTTAVLSSIFRG